MGYIHNYKLPAKVEEQLHEAYAKCQDAEVKATIGNALDNIRKYLSQDNEVYTDDSASAYVRESDTFTDDERNLIRDTFAEILSYTEGKRFILESEEDALGIINKCQHIDRNKEFESVEQFRSSKSAHWTEEG